MNHPTHDQWMEWLYEEATPARRADLSAHLRVCPDCRAQVEEWTAARRQLDAWCLPASHRRSPAGRPVLRWAAAAVLVLGIGFGVGRFSSSSAADVERVRAALEPQLRESLRAELRQTLQAQLDPALARAVSASAAETQRRLTDYAVLAEQRRADDLRAIQTALGNLDRQRLADYTSLRRNLETVAVLTDAGFQQTQQQLVQLADYTIPSPANQPGSLEN